MENLEQLQQQIIENLANVPIAVFIIAGAVAIALSLLYILSMWLIFNKAGYYGILSWIPIINILVLLRIAGKSAWWFLLLIIPFVNIIVAILFWLGLSKNFNHSTLFGIGLILLNPLFLLILALDGAAYQPLRKSKEIQHYDANDNPIPAPAG